jgi:tetratricopeptide (TPR) repeat protein
LGRRAVPLPPSADEVESFNEKLAGWKDEKNVAAAAELVSAAFVLGRDRDAIDAATFLDNGDSTATSNVRRIANLLLIRAGIKHPAKVAVDEHDNPREFVRAAKRRLVEEPRNSILWVDLSRVYATLGQHNSALRAMTIAVKQTVSNRFILRSAARLFVHLDDPEQAHDLLRRREITRHDPWIMAAEIAVASTANRISNNVKRGRETLSSARFDAFDTSELASALGTVALLDGSQSSARKLLRQSLVRPTDNTIAQAGWAARKLNAFQVAPELLTTPRTFEARAWRCYNQGSWYEAIRECRAWLQDEPFSSRPAQLGSFVAAVTLEDFVAAKEFALRGLQANPNDIILLNNLSLSYAEQGDLIRAVQTLNTAKALKGTGAEDIYLTASEGLLQFRFGNVEQGRRLYEEAIRRAEEKELPRAKALALAHLIREEVRIDKNAVPRPLFDAAVELSRQAQPDLRTFIARIIQSAPQLLSGVGEKHSVR